MSDTHTNPQQKPATRGLGRGLDSLLGASNRPAAPASPAAAGEQIQHLAIELIDWNRYQTRDVITEESLKELAQSITASGVMQPVTVRPMPGGRFELIAGERRVRASQLAGKKTIPAIARQVSDEQAMEMTIVENLQREDLNPMEEARAFARLGNEFGLTQEQIAQRTGKERTTIANYIRLLKLPQGVQLDIQRGYVSFGHAKVLLTLPTLETQESLARRIVKEGLSVRETEDLVAHILHFKENIEEAKKKLEADAMFKEAAIDPNVIAAQRDMERALGCRVEIKDRHSKGKIVIKYTSLEDFDRIVEILSGK
jgi:ParB family transcriptional regulator, chromosome partitioning protein